MKKFLFFLAIGIVGLSQFLWINSIPPGMLHDEIEYSLSSKTYALFGEDVSGVAFPLSLLKTETLGSISPVPPLLLSPLQLFLPLTQETARLPYVVLTIMTGALVGYLAFFLFKNKYLAYIACILFLINPWAHFLSHFAADIIFALFFYLLGIVLLLRLNRWHLIFAFLALLLGFFSYHGAKILLLPIVMLCLSFRISLRNEKKKHLSTEIIFFVSILVFFASFFLINRLIPDSSVSGRIHEIIFFNTDLLTNNVDTFRSQSIVSPFNEIFINKATESLRIFMVKYFSAISPVNLFFTGDPTYILGFYYHGLFYWFDIVFILIGGFFLAKNNRKTFFFLLTLILITPLPSAISTNGEAIVTRSFLLLPLLIIISSYGISILYTQIKNPFYKKIYILILVCIISLFYINFIHFYYFRLPIIGQENFVTSQRVLAKYLAFEIEKGTPVKVIVSNPRQIYLETVFFSNPEKQTALLTQNKEAFLRGEYKIDTVEFTSTCPKKIDPALTYVIPIEAKDCLPKQKGSYYIFKRTNSGYLLKILNGHLCDRRKLTTWKSNHTFADFEIEKMDKNTFCDRWLIL